MQIILDSNVYVADFRMQGVAFSTLFDFARKTRSKLLLLRIVREEVVHRYTERYTTQVREVMKAWKAFRYLVLDGDPGEFHKPQLKYQVREVRKRLRTPAKGVTVEYCQDIPGVDINEVALRGIKRIAPASAEGEELRDVIIWYQVLSLAKSASEPTAFVTADTGFWDGESLKLALQEDISAAPALRVYKSIDEFIKANSPLQTKLTDATATHLIPASLFSEGIKSKFSNGLKRAASSFGLTYDLFGAYGGHLDVTDIKPLASRLLDGTIYEIDSTVRFVTATYEYESKAVLKLNPAVIWSASNADSVFGKPTALGFASGLAQAGSFYANPQWSSEQEKITAMTGAERTKEATLIGRASVSTRVANGSIEEKAIESFALEKIHADGKKLDVDEVIGPRGSWFRVKSGGL